LIANRKLSDFGIGFVRGYRNPMLRAFIDDSGSGGDSPWYVLAGYTGTVEGWGSFDAGWCSVLRAPPQIEYFKSSEAERLHSRSQWAGISEEQRNLKIDALIEVIGRCSRRSICARIRQRDYDQLVKGNIPPRWDSPYYFLLPAIVGAAINIERLDGGSEPVDFVFDSDQKHEKGSRQLLPALMPMRSYHGLLVNYTHRDEKDFLPLQSRAARTLNPAPSAGRYWAIMASSRESPITEMVAGKPASAGARRRKQSRTLPERDLTGLCC
jgi:hypothetical protein